MMSNIHERVREKKDSYKRYNFERLQEEAFAAFFDLAQEYTTVDYLYQISVAVPKEFFELESELYVIDPKTSRLEKVCSSETGLIPVEERSLSPLRLADSPYETEDLLVFPIPGNKALTKWIPFLDQNQILGLFGIYPKGKVDEKGHFFLEKLTNRIGYNLHQKLLIQQNINHIKFMILEYLLRHKSQLISRNQLLEHAWDRNVDIFTNIVDTHIKNLRKKLGRYGNYIITIYGSGYRIPDEGSE